MFLKPEKAYFGPFYLISQFSYSLGYRNNFHTVIKSKSLSLKPDSAHSFLGGTFGAGPHKKELFPSK